MEQEKLEEVKIESIQNGVLKELTEVGLINKQGFRLSGQGIIIEKLDKIREETNKTNKQFYFVEKNILERFDKSQEISKEILKRLGEILEKIK